jgi:hypothetical protein
VIHRVCGEASLRKYLLRLVVVYYVYLISDYQSGMLFAHLWLIHVQTALIAYHLSPKLLILFVNLSLICQFAVDDDSVGARLLEILDAGSKIVVQPVVAQVA